MTIIINPGSEIGHAEGAVGWTNTYEKALDWARDWHKSMVDDDGLRDVELIVPDPPIEGDGRWTFHFRHLVTDVTVTLHTHGIDDFDAYQRQCIFNPRVYWNGSSTATPLLADFAAPGFEKVSTFRPIALGGAA